MESSNGHDEGENAPVTLSEISELKTVIAYWYGMPAWSRKYLQWVAVMGKKKVVAGLAAIVVLLIAVGVFLTLVSSPSPVVYTVLGVAIGACLILMLLLA
jgi:hypothetical protein